MQLAEKRYLSIIIKFNIKIIVKRSLSSYYIIVWQPVLGKDDKIDIVLFRSSLMIQKCKAKFMFIMNLRESNTYDIHFKYFNIKTQY